MKVTKYDSIFHTRGGGIEEMEWPEAARRLFSQHEIREEKEGPAVVLGEMDPEQPRKLVHMKEVWAIGLDFDSCTDEELEAALEPLAAFTHAAYTTHSSGSVMGGGLMRLRVIVPLGAPIAPSDYPRVWGHLSSLTGWANDLQVKDAARLHYLPSSRPGSSPRSYTHEARFYTLGEAPEKVPQQPKDGLRRAKKALAYLRQDHPLHDAVKALLAGEAFATKGTRHEAQRGITMRLAQKTYSDPIPDGVIATLFGRSIALMQQNDPTSPGLEAVLTAYRGALEKLQNETDEAQLQGSEPYTPEELEALAPTTQRWIIQKGTGYYIRTPKGYRGPYTKDDFGPAARDHLARAPVPLVEVTASGNKRFRTPQELTREFGSTADRVIVDLTLACAEYDHHTGTFREAPLRTQPHLKPQHHPKVHRWLELFAGEQTETLLDWLACAPHLDRMLAALYLSGSSGSGKTLLAEALANIWSGTCTDVSRVLSDFNEELVHCPVVLADEDLPASFKGQPITAKLRSEIGRTVRPLSRKYQSPSEIHGNIRLILTANRDDLLKSKQALTRDDAEAIAQRFLYLRAPERATKFLLELQYDERTAWKTTKIPEHILHLSQTRRVEPHGRFWVQGTISTMTDLLMTGSDWNSRVCEWLVAYLTRPEPIDAKKDAFLIHDVEGLFVNVRAITEGWEIYFPNTKVEADTRAIADALRSIAKGRTRKRAGGKQLPYFEIDLDMLWSWSERNGVGDVAQMKGRMG